MKRIGFIGVGVMGKSMVRNLMKNGYPVSIYTRTRSKAVDVIEEGAIWYDSIAQCVRNSEVVITIVGYPKDVEEIYFGEKGILANAVSGTYLIDMTTTSPKLSKHIYDAAAKKNMFALDAPVSGGDTGARNATLSIMVGGDREAFDACYPIFQAMGTNIIYEGPAGFGQHTKMANQIAIAGALSGVCEALAYGKKFGLNLQTMLDSISAGAAGSWQMNNLAPRILKEDFAPGFYIKHFIKDMTIAVEEAEGVNLKLAILKDVLKMYKELADNKGLEDLGTQALIKYYDDSQPFV
ncbi:MAG: NAD(P)-dependent oxidoreductase [Caldicoprobacterales bacterium]|jgi:3-hydroxyisobutyrate dehydrogenase-like beta-hydroxyacid dehydrogenase|nr:NAD(P)-dependent oxidoreductase [Clostridiales bacterium]